MKKKFILLLIVMVIIVLQLIPSMVNALSLNDGTIVGKEYSPKEEVKSSNVSMFGKSFVEGSNNITMQPSNSRYITITLHANGGYFDGDTTKSEKESIQFRGDTFFEETIPSHTNPNMIFLGWARSADADSPDVQSGSSHTSMIGTDLYAIWTDHCIVEFNPMGGYFDSPSIRFKSEIYNKGDEINYYIPTSDYGNIFEFEGWYKHTSNNQKVRIPEGYKIQNEEYLNLTAFWRFVPENMQSLELDQPYNTDDRATFFKFTPEETAVYTIYVDNLEYQNEPVDVAIVDSENQTIKKTNTMHGNSVITYTMQAGKTYFIESDNATINQHIYDIGIEKNEEYRIVTFHANRDEQGDAFFDNDETKTTKQIPFSDGEEISQYNDTGLTLKNPNKTDFMGWSIDPYEEYPEEKIIVDKDLDVYAVICDLDTIALDANGGFYPFLDGGTILEYDYLVDSVFVPPYNPHISDNTRKFAGWSRNKNATKPDDDILEGITPNDSLPKTLYAVYTEKILETWDADAANGGFFLNDPSITTYESTKGLGHIFYRLALFNVDSSMVPLGFRDQDGEIIPYTSLEYPFYHNKGDTTYKAIWGYKVIIDCNGGYFPLYGAEAMRLAMPIDESIDSQYLYENLGYPIMDGDENINKCVIGWATTPDATEPDIIEGETPIKGLTRIYAVWGDDEYSFEEGDNSTWEKGSEEGATFVIKRKYYDVDTYSAFTNIYINEELVTSDNYERKEGSLILTLKPEYLETLKLGANDLNFIFAGNTELKTTLTINEKSETPEDTPVTPEKEDSPIIPILPITGDQIILWVILMGASIIGVVGTIIYIKKKK